MIELLETTEQGEGAFDRQVLVEGWKQERLRAAKVMVVGAGAIGNEALKNLALLGCGSLFIVDFDTIAASNLSRTVLFRREDVGRSKAAVAAERLRELCLEPAAQVRAYHGDVVWELGTGVFRAMDLVLGCVDNVEARLAINRQCSLAGIPWIDAGIAALDGHVAFYDPAASACYRCAVSPRQLADSRRRYSCDDFKRRAAAAGEVPTVQVASSLVAALQVQEAVKHLCDLPVTAGVRLHFSGRLNELIAVPLNRRAECPAHLRYPPLEPLDMGRDNTLGQLLEALSAPERSGPAAALDLRSERSYVVRMRCRRCSRWVDLGKPRFALFDTDLRCPECLAAAERDGASEAPAEIEEIGLFRREEVPEAILDMTLGDIGIPLLGVLPVLGAGGEYRYYELTGDRSGLLPSLPAEPQQQGRANLSEE